MIGEPINIRNRDEERLSQCKLGGSLLRYVPKRAGDGRHMAGRDGWVASTGESIVRPLHIRSSATSVAAEEEKATFHRVSSERKCRCEMLPRNVRTAAA